MGKNLVLRSIMGGAFYNGPSGNWTYSESKDIAGISPEFIFDTVEEIYALPDWPARLKYWFTITPLVGIILKPVEKLSYENFSGKIRVLTGLNNEICKSCGSNILVDEKYIRWIDERIYCFHCIMSQMKDIDEKLGLIPADLKSEWIVNGKDTYEKCLRDILKEGDG